MGATGPDAFEEHAPRTRCEDSVLARGSGFAANPSRVTSAGTAEQRSVRCASARLGRKVHQREQRQFADTTAAGGHKVPLWRARSNTSGSASTVMLHRWTDCLRGPFI